jgi:hypothetical protein
MSRIASPGVDHRTIASYAIQLWLRYEMGEYGSPRGEGRTISISSSAVVFEASDSLPARRQVKLSIEWPVKLDNRVDLTFHVRGRTTQGGNRPTVEILSYEFRIRSSAGSHSELVKAAGFLGHV